MKKLFYEPVKETGKDPDFLFWCCLHNGHDPKWDIPLWQRRGYNSSEEHSEGCINKWNSKASKDTVGFLLGDNLFGFDGENRLKKLFDRLIFKKLYVMSGNHYAGWKQVFMSCEENIYTTPSGKQVIFVPNYLEAFINGQAVVMSHYPILSWNGMGKGSWHLFGHVHGSLSNSVLGLMFLENGKNQEVSVEVCEYPLNFSELRNIMKTKDVYNVDHHGKDTQNPF